MLTRFAAYRISMNGQPGKPEVAAAQTDFAVKTRKAETRPAGRRADRRADRERALEITAGAVSPALPFPAWKVGASSRGVGRTA